MKRLYIFFLLCGVFCQSPVFAQVPIKVAAIFSMSGEAVAISIEHLATARFAVEEINAGGGVLGRPVKLIELDNQSTALGSRKAAMEAVKLGVSAVVGGSWSTHAVGMAQVLQHAGIPTISPTATNPKVTEIGDYVFRACFIDSFQGKMLARFVHEDLKVKQVAVLTNVDQVYAIDLSRQFIDGLKRFGIQVSAELDYVESLTHYTDLVAMLSTYEFDAVMLPGYTRDSAHIIKTARAMGVNKVFVGGDGWSHLMLNYADKELDNCYYLTHWHRELQDDKSIAFMEKIVQRFDRSKVNAGMALSYDAVYLLADAIQRANSTEPEEIREAMARTTDFIGVTGRISYDENRNPLKPAVILKFENGMSKVVKQIFPRQVPFDAQQQD